MGNGSKRGPTGLDARDLAVSLKQGPDLALGHILPSAKAHAGDKDAREPHPIHVFPAAKAPAHKLGEPDSSMDGHQPEHLASPATRIDRHFQATFRPTSTDGKLIATSSLGARKGTGGWCTFHLLPTLRW
jgi:hypothetical protein